MKTYLRIESESALLIICIYFLARCTRHDEAVFVELLRKVCSGLGMEVHTVTVEVVSDFHEMLCKQLSSEACAFGVGSPL